MQSVIHSVSWFYIQTPRYTGPVFGQGFCVSCMAVYKSLVFKPLSILKVSYNSFTGHTSNFIECICELNENGVLNTEAIYP